MLPLHQGHMCAPLPLGFPTAQIKAYRRSYGWGCLDLMAAVMARPLKATVLLNGKEKERQ